MDNKTIRILYFESGNDQTALIKELIKEIKDVHCEITHVLQYDNTLLEFDNERYDVVILDLALPGEDGLDIITRLCERIPEIPVVVMTSVDDDAVAIKALQRGAEEYLVKSKLNSQALSRILTYAIMRHKGRVALQSLSLVDGLTKLYNRKGFMLYAKQQLSIAIRTKRGMILFSVHIEGLDDIIEKSGHQYGNMVIIETANILKDVLRESDVVARYGRDEFMAIAIELFDANNEIIISRLQEKLKERNKQENQQYKLSLCVGKAYYDTEELCTIEELVTRAKESMIEQTKDKR